MHWQLFSGEAVQGAWGRCKTVCTGGIHNPLFVKVCPYQVGLSEFSSWRDSQRVSSSYLRWYWLSGFVHPCPLYNFNALHPSENCTTRWWWRWWFVTKWYDGGALVVETEMAGISCQVQSSHSTFDSPYRGISSWDAWNYPAALQRSTRVSFRRLLGLGPSFASDLLAEKGFPFHTLNHIAARAVSVLR